MTHGNYRERSLKKFGLLCSSSEIGRCSCLQFLIHLCSFSCTCPAFSLLHYKFPFSKGGNDAEPVCVHNEEQQTVKTKDMTLYQFIYICINQLNCVSDPVITACWGLGCRYISLSRDYLFFLVIPSSSLMALPSPYLDCVLGLLPGFLPSHRGGILVRCPNQAKFCC